MAVQTLSVLSDEAKQFHDKDLLYRAEQAQIVYEAGRKKMLPKRSGNSIGWRRFNALAVATSALTEGTTPSSTALSTTEVTATVAQYGAYCEVSDMLDLLGIDPVISEAIEVFGQQAGESVETLVFDVIKAGTNVLYATGSARNAQTTSGVLTVALLRKAVRTLDANNTKRFNGANQNKKIGQGEYLAFIHPNAVFDLKQDTEWKTHVQQSGAYEKLYNGEIGMIEGVRLIQSTLCPIFSDAGASSAEVYATIVVGENAFGVVDVAGIGKFETKVKQIGSAGTADPLDQRGTVGWVTKTVSKILNNNFMVRIEHGATDQT